MFSSLRRYILNLAGHSCFHSSRCGLTLMLSTNLVVWMAAVTEESIHQTEIPELNVNISHKMYRGNMAKFALLIRSIHVFVLFFFSCQICPLHFSPVWQ